MKSELMNNYMINPEDDSMERKIKKNNDIRDIRSLR